MLSIAGLRVPVWSPKPSSYPHKTQKNRKPTPQRMSRLKYTLDQVLTLNGQPMYSATVRRYYKVWRKQHGLPERCDTLVCQFHTVPLKWNGVDLPLILDHVSGNRDDNRPQNLRLLCPNCDSQNIETRAGANVGKIERMPDGSYVRRRSDGTKDAVLKAQSSPPSTSFGIPTNDSDV